MIRRLVVLCTLTTLFVPFGAAHAATCDGSLSIPPQPAPRRGGIFVVGSSPEAGDWGVGVKPNRTYSTQTAFSERWDGTEWVRVSMARPRTFEPKDMAVLGDRVYVVGRQSDRVTGGDAGSRIEMWDGTSWSVMDTPPIVSSVAAKIWAVGGSSAADVWAGGRVFDQGVIKLLMLHYDGQAWTAQFAPMPYQLEPDGDIEISSIAAASASDAWAVGYGHPFGEQSFALHWTGDAWHAENPTVTDAPSNNELDDVASVGSRTWAVGWAEGNALLLRWNGMSWRRIASPVTGYDTNRIGSVSIGSRVVVGGSGWNGVPPNPQLEYFARSSGAWAPLTAPFNAIADLTIDANGGLLASGTGRFAGPTRIAEGCLV